MSPDVREKSRSLWGRLSACGGLSTRRFVGLSTAGALLSFLASAPAEVLDRIAVSVGRQVISESAVLLDLRVSAFLDRKPLDFSPAAKRRSAGRLVDQILILQEAADSHVTLAVDADVQMILEQIKAQYGTDYEAAIARYGITAKDVEAQIATGLRALRFSDLRFGPEIQISDQDLRAYYDQLVAGWKAQNRAEIPSFESSQDQIRQLLTERRVSDALDRWLEMTRNVTQIVYRPQVIP